MYTQMHNHFKERVIVNSVSYWKKISSGILAGTIIMLTPFNGFTDSSEGRKKNPWDQKFCQPWRTKVLKSHLYKLRTSLTWYRVSDRWREFSWGRGREISAEIQNKNYSTVTVWGIKVGILSKHFSSIFP